MSCVVPKNSASKQRHSNDPPNPIPSFIEVNVSGIPDGAPSTRIVKLSPSNPLETPKAKKAPLPIAPPASSSGFTQVHVSGIPEDTAASDGDIEEIFTVMIPECVQDISITMLECNVMRREDGACRGYCFLSFLTFEGARTVRF
jgi:hypothetical protein